MPGQNGQIFEFGDFQLIPDEGLLLRNGEPVALGPKIFATLLLLVERHGHLVQKSELMDEVWADSFVEENAVSKSIWAIRTALGGDPKVAGFIQTVPKRGYRFVADVKELRRDARGNLLTADANGNDSEYVTKSRIEAQPIRKSRRILAIGAMSVLVLVLVGLSGGQFRDWYLGPGPSVAIRSLSVLPFENASNDPSQDYFVDGMADALVTDLSKIRELRVVGRSSAPQYKGISTDLAAIGKELDVDALLTGSVARSGERVRITVQLIHAQTGRKLWVSSYDRNLRDVVALEKEVARSIAKEVRIQLSPQEEQQFDTARSIDPEAYDLYLRGRYHLNLQNENDQDIAIGLLERSVAIDPTFATAYAELAQAYTWKHFSFAPDETELAEKAFVATERALSMDPDLAVTYLARGRLLWTPANHFPHETSIQEYHRALQLNPNLDEAHNQLALVYCHIGALDEALREAREGAKINPANNLIQLRIGQTLNFQMKYEEALAVLRSIPNKTHPSVVGHQTAWSLFNLGRKEEASEKLQQLLRDHRDKGGTFASIQAVIAASSGQNQLAEELIKRALENGKGYGHFHHTAYTIACA